MQVVIRVKESELEQASWQAEGVSESGRIKVANMFVSPCLVVVKRFAKC